MVSATEVEMAYRLFLGREPENGDIIARHVQAYPSLRALREGFLQSREFEEALARVGRKATIRPWNVPQARIDTTVPPDILQKLVTHVEASWTKLGASEPHWSVLTHELFRSDRIRDNEAAFFQSGEATALMFRRAAERAGIDTAGFAAQTCFELGCGVGRISLQLSKMFDSVIAVDISSSHLKVAQDATARANRHNIEFVRLSSIDVIDRLPKVDAFVSIIVLQHNPPPLMKLLLESCLRRLRPNGIGYFQLPYYGVNYQFSAEDYIRRIEAPNAHDGMEMHVLPQPVIFDVVASTGCQVLEMLEDGWCGEGYHSCSLLVRKI